MRDEIAVRAGIGWLSGARTRLLAVGWNEPEILMLDPDTGTLTASVQIPDGERVGPIFDTGDEVLATGSCGHIVRVTGMDHPQVHKVRISDVSQQFSAALAVGSLWIADEARSELVRVDLRTAEVVARLPVETADPDDPAFAIVPGQRSVWVIDTNLPNGVLRVDPTANRVQRLASATDMSTWMSAVVAAPPT
ncbi:MAG TPA: hypothetical protein VF462_00085 [Micromonosporaceae bacterium]